MNENIDLTKILKNCPTGTKFYSSIYGEVLFRNINENNVEYPVIVYSSFYDSVISFTREGRYANTLGECTLFPSNEQRDWSKFTAPWYKKEKFDPKTLKAFDRVLVRDCDNRVWGCSMFSHIVEDEFPYACFETRWKRCIPFNDETKHLVGTTKDAPDYYRYWED